MEELLLFCQNPKLPLIKLRNNNLKKLYYIVLVEKSHKILTKSKLQELRLVSMST